MVDHGHRQIGFAANCNGIAMGICTQKCLAGHVKSATRKDVARYTEVLSPSAVSSMVSKRGIVVKDPIGGGHSAGSVTAVAIRRQIAISNLSYDALGVVAGRHRHMAAERVNGELT